METYQEISLLIGRILIGGLFLLSGILSTIGFEGFYFATASVLPFATFFAIVAIIFKIVGGLSVLLGIYTRIGAIILIVFTIVATLLFHIGPGEAVAATKNLFLIGGLLAYIACGGGKYSIK